MQSLNLYDYVYNNEIKDKLTLLNEKELGLQKYIQELESKSIQIGDIEKRIVTIKQK